MTTVNKVTNLNYYHKSPKLWRSAFIFLAASSLFACSQSETIASNDSAIKESSDSASVVQVEQPAAQASVVAASVNAPISNPDLLKNVSATVYKDPNCGCCKEWVNHAQGNGLTATVQHPENLSLFKDSSGVPENMRSCHTTVTTDGFVFEGHVPAKYMAEFLANPPTQALGLAVPGMPMGSPGMEYQNKFAPYQVMQLNKDGSTEVYADIKTVQQQL